MSNAAGKSDGGRGGPKLTKNQSIVIGALKQAGRPLSAYQILDIEAVRGAGLKAPLTIYRALDKLVEHGLVHRIESLNAFVVCEEEAHVEPAAFMICRECKQTIEFPATSIRRQMAKQAEAHGFRIEQINLEVTGLCAACQMAA
jgi:Fur family zinc uptake transcriptional regulator